MALFIGVEGVGMSFSVAVAADETGTVLSSVRLEGAPISLHTTDRRELRSRLAELLRTVCERAEATLEQQRNATVCLGLTGVTFPYDSLIDLPDEFDKMERPVRRLICTGDAEIVFASHAKCDHGSAIVCHMGSTAYVVAGKRRVRYGGWGPVLGDEGSGYWMGRAALRAIGEEYDGCERESVLWREIREWLQDPGSRVPEWTESALLWKRRLEQLSHTKLDVRTALFAFCHELSQLGERQWRAVASGVTTPLMRAWRAHDPAATTIVEEGATHLAKQYTKALNVAGLVEPNGPVVFYGGVLTHNPEFRCLLEAKVVEKVGVSVDPVTVHTQGTMRPACGALMFALGDSTTQELHLPNAQVIRHLAEDQEQLHREGQLSND